MDTFFLDVCPWRWLMKRNSTLLFLQWGFSSFCLLLVYWVPSLMAHLHQHSAREHTFVRRHPKAKSWTNQVCLHPLFWRFFSSQWSHCTAGIHPFLHPSSSARPHCLAAMFHSAVVLNENTLEQSLTYHSDLIYLVNKSLSLLKSSYMASDSIFCLKGRDSASATAEKK